MKKFIVIIFFMIQIGMIIRARFVEDRYFCWAPYDSHNEYTVDVRIKDRPLSEQEIRSRYQIYTFGHEARSSGHVKNMIRQYETTYGKNDGAKVTLFYKVNGIERDPWRWPP